MEKLDLRMIFAVFLLFFSTQLAACADSPSPQTGQSLAQGAGQGDDIPPQSTILLSPPSPDGSSDWYISPVKVRVTAEDDSQGSGVDELRCSLDLFSEPQSFEDLPPRCRFEEDGILVEEDGYHSLYVASVDQAGNQERVKVQIIPIDQTAPEVIVAIPVNAEIYTLDEEIEAKYLCGDELSGIRVCKGTVERGDRLDTHTAGPKYLKIYARDQAGNEVTKVIYYDVVARVAN